MSEAKQKKDLYPLHFCLTVIIMVVIRFVPPPGSVTPYGMAVLGIYRLDLWVDVHWPFDSKFSRSRDVGHDWIWKC